VRRSWWSVVAAGLLALASIGRTQMDVPDDPLAYGVFALESLRLGRGSDVAGAVGVNEGEARLGRGTKVEGVVAAEVVALGRRASAGELVCTLVVGGKATCIPLVGPVVPQAALELVRVEAGPSDVVVPRRGRRVALPAGAYRRVRIGRGSSLSLAGGEYQLRSLVLARGAALVCTTSCRVRIMRKVVVGRRGTIAPVGEEPALLRLDVQGKRVRTAIRLGSRARFTGTLYGPGAGARLGRRVRVTGSLVARSVRTGARARIERP
jgi:hypothetical protein